MPSRLHACVLAALVGSAAMLTAQTPVSFQASPAFAHEPFRFTVVGNPLDATGRGLDRTSLRVTFTGPGCAEPKPCEVTNAKLVPSAGAPAGQLKFEGQMTLNAGRFGIAIFNGQQRVDTKAMAVAPRLFRVWNDPIVPGRPIGVALKWSGLDAANVRGVIRGAGCPPAPNGCPITFDSTLSPTSFLSGTATLPARGDYQIILNDSSVDSNPLELNSLKPERPRIDHMATTPEIPRSGVPFTLEISGRGFNPAKKAIVAPTCPPTTCRFDVDPQRSTENFLSIKALVAFAGAYAISAGDVDAKLLSDPKPLQVAKPMIRLVTEPQAPVAGAPFKFIIDGQGFSSGAQVRVNGQLRAARVVSSTQIAGSMTLAAGRYVLIVHFNPRGESEGAPLVVLAPPRR